MTWQLMWCRMRVAVLNAAFQFLVIYIYYMVIMEVNKLVVGCIYKAEIVKTILKL